MVVVRWWRYRSAFVATFVVALGNISLFLGVALAHDNLKESVNDECSIANIKQYVTQIEKAYSSELEAKFKKCAAVAVPWLIEQTEVDNADTQVTVISLLAMIGTDASSAAPRLIELLKRSQNENLRILAVSALPKVASSENLKSIIAALGSTLKDKNQDVKIGSAFSLVEIYKDKNKLNFSSSTVNDLRKLVSKAVVYILTEAYKKDDISFILFLSNDRANTLGQIIISEYAVPVLISALKDTDKDVRYAAANALGEIGKDAKDSIPILISTLKDMEKDVSYSAANALEEISKDAKVAIPELIPALKDIEKDIRYTAAVNTIRKKIENSKETSTQLTVFPISSNRNFMSMPTVIGALKKIKSPEASLALTNYQMIVKYNEIIKLLNKLHLNSGGDSIRTTAMSFSKRNYLRICRNDNLTRLLFIEWKCLGIIRHRK
jgi:HEAT repeat protein